MNRLLATLALSIAFAPVAARAEIKLPPVIASHMVLQRDSAVPIWGLAAPGEKITVKFQDQALTTEAGKDGKWLVKLAPLKAGGPEKMTINDKVLEDILIGEVWVGSGQSNMAGSVNGYVKADPVLAKYLAGAPYPKVRQATVNGGWKEATPANVGGFSALLFSFGLRLHQELDVPIGLLHGSVGGTPSGFWLSEAAFKADQPCQELIAVAAKTYNPEAEKKKYEADLAKWEKDNEAAKKDNKKSPRKPDAPLKPGECRGKLGNLYESHIRGFQPFAIRGVLWDQGESGTAIRDVDQFTLMGALIRGWRSEWGQGDFSFIYVQKPSGGGCAWDKGSPTTKEASDFAALPAAVPPTSAGLYRELHVRIMKYPKTAMAIATDLGSDTHPINKSGYGDRASRVALGLAYGKKIEYYGPVYESHKVDGNRLLVKFSHVGQGLAFKHGDKLQGFAIAGEDKKFYWADATIEGDMVIVSSPQVAKPAAVRYAWGQTHPWANLFNKDGLPALMFRTDSW
jgi:sialate O-acetylesterase